jgi:phosphoribosyl 1,2-cyclic phosphodiesterase
VRVFALATGSSGNCLVFEAEGERILVDAGIGPTRAVERMRSLGADLVTSRAPLGVFVTHDHGDHAAHALPIARALRAPLYAHDAAMLDRARRRLDVRSYAPGGPPVVLGPFVVESLPVPHDAPHVALRIAAGGCRVAVATDVGHPTRDLKRFLAATDLVLLEANYCAAMLETGPYPPRLRARVAGPLGHLANDQAAEIARELEDSRVGRLVLIHLSRANNTPERALEVVASAVRRLAVEALPHGMPHLFDVVRRTSTAYAEQLRLPILG